MRGDYIKLKKESDHTEVKVYTVQWEYSSEYQDNELQDVQQH